MNTDSRLVLPQAPSPMMTSFLSRGVSRVNQPVRQEHLSAPSYHLLALLCHLLTLVGPAELNLALPNYTLIAKPPAAFSTGCVQPPRNKRRPFLSAFLAGVQNV